MIRNPFLFFLIGLGFFLGGCPGTGPTSPGLSNWTKVGDAPWAGRHFLHGTVFNNQMWVIGGLSTNNDASVTQFYGDVWSSPNGSSWTNTLTTSNSISNYFGRRYGHRVLSLGTTLYLIGGHSGSVRNDVWASTDGAVWTNILPDQTPSATQFSKRMDFGAEVYNGAMWVIGGYATSDNDANDVWTSTNGIVWTQVLANTNAPGPNQFDGRWGHSTAVHNGLLWVIGGASGPPAASPVSDGKSDVWSSPDGVTWTQVYPGYAFGAIYYHQTVANAGLIWMTCGWKWPTWGPQKYAGNSPNGINWTFTNDVPFPGRFYHLSLAFQNSVWIMGGMNNIGARTYYRDVWRSP